jgi:uncharacterized repeat protein (TIGR03843 family)
MLNIPEKDQILTALQDGVIDLQGQFMLGSNYTFLAQLTHESQTFPVVYKPLRGERPLWDFPIKTLGKREAAAFMVSEALGWDLVPPVVFRKKGPFGAGSCQLFVEHDPEYHYFRFSEADHQRLRPTALFDLVINNADRKGGHILVGTDSHLWLIDHGICFHREHKLRTVVWDFINEPIPANLLLDLQRFAAGLHQKDETCLALRTLLKVGEINAMLSRVDFLLEHRFFPAPITRYAVPYPPI